MPGSARASAIALAAITESPIATTCEPVTVRRAAAGTGTGVTGWPAASARLAALTRSPLLTCLASPADAPSGADRPQPAVPASASSTAARTTRPPLRSPAFPPPSGRRFPAADRLP